MSTYTSAVQAPLDICPWNNLEDSSRVKWITLLNKTPPPIFFYIRPHLKTS